MRASFLIPAVFLVVAGMPAISAADATPVASTSATIASTTTRDTIAKEEAEHG